MTAADADQGLRALFAKIARERGFCCASYKENCLRRRIAARMRARGVHEYQAYARLLDDDPAEYERLIAALTINVTKFYRNRETWDALLASVLPDLWAHRRGALRAWSAGCATGEEPYTLAMVFLELARRFPQPGRPRIDATDLDAASLERSREGRYRPAALDELPPELTRRYFTGTSVRAVAPEVRALVEFRAHDVLRDPPPRPPYDLVLCRNVVIYFDRPTQERVFLTLVDALAPEGILVLGKVETLVGPARERLASLDARERIYRRA